MGRRTAFPGRRRRQRLRFVRKDIFPPHGRPPAGKRFCRGSFRLMVEGDGFKDGQRQPPARQAGRLPLWHGSPHKLELRGALGELPTFLNSCTFINISGRLPARISLPMSCRTLAVNAASAVAASFFRFRSTHGPRKVPPGMPWANSACNGGGKGVVVGILRENPRQKDERLDPFAAQNHDRVQQIGDFADEAKKAELTSCSNLADMTGSWPMRLATTCSEPWGSRNSSVTCV